MAKLTFQPAPPLPLPSVPVPPLADSIGDYCFAYDPRGERLIYAPTPEPHQMRAVHAFDGEAWTEVASAHYRLGSQGQPWRALWDPRREVVVAWSFDGDKPVGVVLGDGTGTIIGEEKVARFGAEGARRVLTTGEHPRRAESSDWSDLVGVFGVDETRGVTVCLTADAIYELDGTLWRRCATVEGLPAQAEGQTSFNASAGFGGCWDAAGGRLLFWLHDTGDDVPRVFAWKDGAFAPVAATGLPDRLWGFGPDSGYAVGPHPRHGLVVYVGPSADREGWFALDGDRFVPLPAPSGEAPPRSKGAHLGCHHGRGLTVLGPSEVHGAPQRVFHLGDAATGHWRRMGVRGKKSVLADLTSNRFSGLSDGAMHATDEYLKTARHDGAEGWRLVVDTEAGDTARRGKRALAACTAWGGRLHALLADGGLLRLEGAAWRQVSGPDEGFTADASPLLAFDEARGLLVCWGPQKKSGGRKDETLIHDGKAWQKVKKGKARLAEAERFDLVYDAGRGGVVRLGDVELAVFDGKAWTPSPLAGTGISSYHRCVGVADGNIVVLNPMARTLLRVEGERIVEVGDFDKPMPRDPIDNMPFDTPWFDPISSRFVGHCDEDDRVNVALPV